MRVTVFCGSRTPTDPIYAETAADLGRALAAAGVEVLFGGTGSGTMLALADAVLHAGGSVVGVITDELRELEHVHPTLTELHIVDALAERKTLLIEWADAFVALPGGLGTLDELFDVAVRAQVGGHTRPIVLVNVAGFYDRLLDFLDHAVDQELMKPAHRGVFTTVDSIGAAVEAAIGPFVPLAPPVPPVPPG